MIIFFDLSYSAFLVEQWTPPSPQSEGASLHRKAVVWE